MNPNDRGPRPETDAASQYKSLLVKRVDPTRPRGEQMPASKLAPPPPKGRDVSGISVRSKGR